MERAGAFTRTSGEDTPDASDLVMPMVGFLPATNPRLPAPFRGAIRCADDVESPSEEVDAGTGEPTGVCPQAFGNIGLVNAAGRSTRRSAESGAASAEL